MYPPLKQTIILDLLKDERNEVDLAGPTLPALKTLLEPPSDPKLLTSDSSYGRIVHGLVSACLLNIDEMRYDALASICREASD